MRMSLALADIQLFSMSGRIIRKYTQSTTELAAVKSFFERDRRLIQFVKL